MSDIKGYRKGYFSINPKRVGSRICHSFTFTYEGATPSGGIYVVLGMKEIPTPDALTLETVNRGCASVIEFTRNSRVFYPDTVTIVVKC
ncbi:MAG TPA: hypothetical protein VEL11_08160 [Candidatus Bathyarchaeia archaeon]|nr:hypothetical protein [Candidatus Bathyarchaeia archaeon]